MVHLDFQAHGHNVVVIVVVVLEIMSIPTVRWIFFLLLLHFQSLSHSSSTCFCLPAFELEIIGRSKGLVHGCRTTDKL